ncbi:hypothetical protein BH20ACT6_BH20ACT6_24810 [soil metagenome]
MRRSRLLALGIIAAVLVAVGAGAVAVWSPPEEPAARGGPASARSSDDPSVSADPEPADPEPADLLLALPRPLDPAPALGAASGPVADRLAVRAVLRPLLKDPDLRRHTGVVIRDLRRDREVLRAGGDDPFVPASTLKLLTAAAALSELGPDHRFVTSVARASGRPAARPTVVLVGGGDPLLASTAAAAELRNYPAGATLSGLATRTARALRAGGVRKVRVGYDESLFTGRSVARTWEPNYVPDGVVYPISALLVDGGRFGAGQARAAADTFVQELRARGVQVSGGAPRRVRADNGAVTLAREPGAALEDVVEHVLQVSDNEGAEMLLRHVGLSTGRAGSFVGGVAGARQVLSELGVPFEDITMHDGSGLSRSDQISLAGLSRVLQLGADPDHPELRVITTGVPVAGFTGSLSSRFLGSSTTTGRGVVRAKTGTLLQVHALAGTVVTRDGTLLGFAALTDRVRLRDNIDARQQIDEIAAALAGCGCAG